MSTLAYGKIIFDKKLDPKTCFQISFEVCKAAVINTIGIKMGYNVSDFVKKTILNDIDIYEAIPFELSDNPLMEHAEVLFSEDNVEVYLGDTRIDNQETLEMRMQKLQKFFSDITCIKEVGAIELYIRIEPGDEYSTKKIKTTEFYETILECYQLNGEPIIKIVMAK